MYCNGFLVVTIFFIYFLKSFYTYVEFQGVSSLTPGRVSSPEHPGPSLEPLSDIFCESAVSCQLSQCCAQCSAHVPFSSSSIGLFGCRHQCSSQRQLWGARARLLPFEAGSLTSAACSRLAGQLLGLLLSLPPISLWELWDYSADADQHIQLVTGALVSRLDIRPGRQSAQTH